MTLDCTNLKPGDKVRLRNGIIDTVMRNDHDCVPIRLEGCAACHYPDGRWHEGKIHDLDIVEILTNPQPEMDTTTPTTLGSYSQLSRILIHPDRSAFIDHQGLGYIKKITINGKQYVPANPSPEPIMDRSPSLSYPLPHQPTLTVSAITNEVVAITCNGKRFTPADSWPEPITDRGPTLEDADSNGHVQRLDEDGDWMRHDWDFVKANPERGWAHTSDWRPTPLDKKALTLRDLKESLATGNDPEPDTIQSAIELLEATS